MRFAYADPPYWKSCAIYGHRHENPYGCWNHLETHYLLIDTLIAEYPDGWALSMTSNSLRHLLPRCPEGTRVASWTKAMCAARPGIFPIYTWEPVVFWGGRHVPKGGEWIRDSIVANAVHKSQNSFVGKKPTEVCRWIANMLGYQDGDEVVDLFPGTDSMAQTLAQGVLLLD